MLNKNFQKNKVLINTLKKGGIVVMPTDTIYGIVGKAENLETVKRIYKIRKRNPDKPCIILISDISFLEKFGIFLNEKQGKILKEFFPASAPTSVILDCTDEKFAYLHRGTNTLAFRMPAQIELQNLLKITGPLIAPSANTEGLPPSKNIKEAKNYFGKLVDLYIDGGEIIAKPSRIIRLHKDGTGSIIRE